MEAYRRRRSIGSLIFSLGTVMGKGLLHLLSPPPINVQ